MMSDDRVRSAPDALTGVDAGHRLSLPPGSANRRRADAARVSTHHSPPTSMAPSSLFPALALAAMVPLSPVPRSLHRAGGVSHEAGRYVPSRVAPEPKIGRASCRERV